MSAVATKRPRSRRRKKQDRLPMVYGLGNTGLSVARYFLRQGVAARFVDNRHEPPGLEALHDLMPDAMVDTGAPSPDLLESVSRLVVSPGIPDSDAFLSAARERGVDIVSDIELFVEEAGAPFVAITGSNGKSTVTTLVALMGEAAGRRVLAGANLGVPALDLLAEEMPEFYVLELSSFQLQRTAKLPAKVAAVLNVSPDHLDWHSGEAEYRQAKLRIFDQAESAVYNRHEFPDADGIPDGIPSLSFALDEPGASQYGVRIEDGEEFLARGEQLLLAAHDIAMVGRHNIENALAALAVGQLLGLEISPMLQVLNEFPGLPHRMQPVRTLGGVAFVNDSKATNVGAAIAAIASLHEPVVLIAGGQGKGGDFERLATAAAGRVRAVILIGEDAALLADAFEGLADVEFAADMQDAVGRAAAAAESGDTVLLAPACASFDQFDNYQARGDEFRRVVEELGR